MLNDDTPEGIEAFNKSLDLMLSDMVDKGLISMGWDAEKEAVVYFLTDEQRNSAEDTLGDLNQYLPEEGSDD
jgi:DNA-binding PadR family transcriptional regulator